MQNKIVTAIVAALDAACSPIFLPRLSIVSETDPFSVLSIFLVQFYSQTSTSRTATYFTTKWAVEYHIRGKFLSLRVAFAFATHQIERW